MTQWKNICEALDRDNTRLFVYLGVLLSVLT